MSGKAFVAGVILPLIAAVWIAVQVCGPYTVGGVTVYVPERCTTVYVLVESPQ